MEDIVTCVVEGYLNEEEVAEWMLSYIQMYGNPIGFINSLVKALTYKPHNVVQIFQEIVDELPVFQGQAINFLRMIRRLQHAG